MNGRIWSIELSKVKSQSVAKAIAAFILTFRTFGKPDVPAEKQSKGVHIVFTPKGAKIGLGKYLQSAFGLDAEARRAMYDTLKEQGFLTLIPAKGGAMVYLAGDAPTKRLSAEARAVADAKAAEEITAMLAPTLKAL